MDKLFKIFIVAIFGIVLIKACNRQAEISSWGSSSAQIISYDIERYKESEKRKTTDGKIKRKWDEEFRIYFTYSFIDNNFTYTGRFSIDDLETEREVNRVLERNAVGKNIQIKYDPLNPNDSVYQR